MVEGPVVTGVDLRIVVVDIIERASHEPIGSGSYQYSPTLKQVVRLTVFIWVKAIMAIVGVMGAEQHKGLAVVFVGFTHFLPVTVGGYGHILVVAIVSIGNLDGVWVVALQLPKILLL